MITIWVEDLPVWTVFKQSTRTNNLLFVCPRRARIWAKITFHPDGDWCCMTRQSVPGIFPRTSPPGSLFTADPVWDQGVLSGLSLLDLSPLMIRRELDLWYSFRFGALSMNNPSDLTERIAALRAKILSNTATNDETKEAFAMLRQHRVSASFASESSRARKAPAAPIDASKLLDLFAK